MNNGRGDVGNEEELMSPIAAPPEEKVHYSTFRLMESVLEGAKTCNPQCPKILGEVP